MVPGRRGPRPRGAQVNTDVSRNVVVFQLKRRRGQHAVAEGPTRHDDCIQQAWQTVQREHGATAKDVRALHSEWEPSPADASFIRTTFPKAALTYNFSRPEPDGWDAAFATARRVIADAGAKQTTENMRLVAEHGELLPVLWSDASPKKELLEYLPHRPIAPGRLYVALATVGPTSQGTIGMSHVTHGGLEGRTFPALLADAAANLTRGLSIDGHTGPCTAGAGCTSGGSPRWSVRRVSAGPARFLRPDIRSGR